MSSENDSDGPNGDVNNESEGGRICRDFQRNVCRRGKRCKFLHPHENMEGNEKQEYNFCHDYQNFQCHRINCRFVHCTQKEESFYKETGELPLHVLETMLRKGMAPDILPGRPGEAPVCKDYLKGECRRGRKCKFRHLSVREYNREVAYVVRSPPGAVNNGPIARCRERFDCDDRYNNMDQYDEDLKPPSIKRRYMNPDVQMNEMCLRENYQPTPNGHFYMGGMGMMSHAEARTLMMEDENMMLRKRVEDLTATNEFLLDQNAQLRMGGKRTASVTAVTVPAVTITNTGASTMQVQPLTAQIQPSQAPTPQQMVNAAVAAGALRTVTASMATVPVSIAAVAGTPVSIATVSMAPVQITPPVVTMAQQTITVEGPQPPQQPGPPPQQGQQQNPQQAGPQSLPMSMSGATAPMVSYPIMTQDLRPVLQNSLSH